MEILVFKTNIKSRQGIYKIKSHLNQIEEVLQWNVDLTDNEKILRVKAENIHPEKIINLVNDIGFHCEELV